MGGPHGWQTSYKAWESDDSDRRDDVPSIPRLAVGDFRWLPIELNQRSGAADRPPMSFRCRRGRYTEDTADGGLTPCAN